MTNKRDKKNLFRDDNLDFKQMKKNQRIQDIVSGRIGNLRRKLSRGASNIYRMIRSRAKWGNKQLWGFREKGRNKPSDSK